MLIITKVARTVYVVEGVKIFNITKASAVANSIIKIKLYL